MKEFSIDYTYIDEIKNEFYQCINFYCDTRDFFVRLNKEDVLNYKLKSKLDKLLKLPNIDEFAYNIDEAYNLLKNYEKNSIPEHCENEQNVDWRYLSFKCENDTWVKYIGGIRYNMNNELFGDKFIMYFLDCNDITPLRKNVYKVELINKEEL